MNRWIVGAAAVGALAAVGAHAQDRGPFRDGRGERGGPSAEDRAAFGEARIAALRAGLKLTPDQEKLWSPVEEAVRGLVAERRAAREARHERFASTRDDAGMPDIPGALRFMADRQAASAAALGKLSDALAPLYGSLDEAQKRRFAVLARPFRHEFGTGHGGPGRHQHGDHGLGDRDRGGPGREDGGARHGAGR